MIIEFYVVAATALELLVITIACTTIVLDNLDFLLKHDNLFKLFVSNSLQVCDHVPVGVSASEHTIEIG